MATFDKVRDIVVEQLGVEADEVALESTFIDDLGAQIGGIGVNDRDQGDAQQEPGDPAPVGL